MRHAAQAETLGRPSQPIGCLSTRFERGNSMFSAIAVIAVGMIGVMTGHSEARSRQAAQTPKSVINADIVAMTTAKLLDDVIVSAVQQAATTDFDLSPGALIALRNAGVSDRVIQAMQARTKTAQPKEAQPNPAGGLGGAAAESAPSEPCRIFITEEDPPSRAYVVVRKEVQAGKKFYGSHDDNLMKELAKQADKAGADAIIKFHEWRAPSMWSWAAAKAGGMAVKWTAEGKTGISALKGQCWSPKGQDRE